jgi:phosphinothricin tripeptide acetyl hydrolase
VTAGGGSTKRRRLQLGSLLLAVAAVGVGWLFRNRRRRDDGPSLSGRVLGFWVRTLYRPFTDRAAELDLQLLRRRIDRGRFIRPPWGVRVEGSSADEVKVEWLTPKRRLAGRQLLYLHGGGFLMGGLGSHRHWVASLARAFQARALHLEYRVAPEHPYPAPLDDCVATYRWLLDSGVDPQQLILAGESAGAGLVMSTMLRARQEGLPLPRAAICISGVFDFTFSGPSHSRNGHSDYIEARGVLSMEQHYLSGHDPRDPMVSSIFADLTGLPPLFLVAGGDELLLSDTQMLADRAGECGVEVTLRIVPGMVHAFPVMLFLPEARRVLHQMKEFVDRQWDGRSVSPVLREAAIGA